MLGSCFFLWGKHFTSRDRGGDRHSGSRGRAHWPDLASGCLHWTWHLRDCFFQTWWSSLRPHCWSPWQVAFRETFGHVAPPCWAWPSLGVGLPVCAGPVGSQLRQPQRSCVSGPTEQMKEDGVLRMCVGAAAPTPARTPAPSTLPCLLRPLGDRWWLCKW